MDKKIFEYPSLPILWQFWTPFLVSSVQVHFLGEVESMQIAVL